MLYMRRKVLGHTLQGGGSSGGGGQTTTSVQKNFTPQQEAGIAQIIDEGSRLYGRQPTLTGEQLVPRIAPQSPETQLAQNFATNFALTQAPGIVNNMSGAVNFGLNDIINGRDPTLQAATDAVTRNITRQYTDPDGLMAKTRSYFGEAGQPGGTREATYSGVLGGRYMDAVGDATAKLEAQSRQDSLNTFAKTMAFSPQLMSSALTPANVLSSVGAQKENLNQANLSRESAVAQANQMAPWQQLSNFANIIYGSPVSGTTTTANPQFAGQNYSMGGVGSMLSGVAALLPFIL